MNDTNFLLKKTIGRWLLILGALSIVFTILWNTYLLVEQTKKDERQRMELWALAQKQLVQNTDINQNISQLNFRVLTSENNIPMILVDKNNQILLFNNIDYEKAVANDSLYLKKTLAKIKKENPPIDIIFKGDVNQKMYYGNSSLLTKIRYYPVALLLVLLFIGGLIFYSYRTSQISLQNKLWVGMAKETAHQIGTPLSSLMGWIALLKQQNGPSKTLLRMQEDIHRLEMIAQRFSKIGSVPKLEIHEIGSITERVVNYMRERASSSIQLELEKTNDKIELMLNYDLYSWVIENLIKNSIDALKKEGKINVSIVRHSHYVNVKVIDTGKGIPKKLLKSVFKPGVTSKKRGWGLGLSLSKRIIEDYHNGKIKVAESNESGTVVVLSLPMKT